MRTYCALRATLGALLLPLLPTATLAAKDTPDIKVTTFDNEILALSYFDETDTVLLHDRSLNLFRSTNAGATWKEIKDIPQGVAGALVLHEWDNNRAYVLTEGNTHFKTSDRGETWQKFFTDADPDIFKSEVLQFHAGDPDRILFNGVQCLGILCETVAMYTTDGFKSDAKMLRAGTDGCWWVKSSALFTTGKEDLDAQRVLCVVQEDSFFPAKSENRLLISDNYFSAEHSGGEIQEFEPNIDTDRPAKGIVNLAVVKKHLLVASMSKNTDEMALFVTDDTLKWHRAMFPADYMVNQESYTVLESTNYSIQIDVETGKRSNPMGTMFTSNSNGTFFTANIEHTNRNEYGHVDFEKIAGIQGIFMVNKVDNFEEVQKGRNKEKQIITEITHDDGRTFAPITADKDRIHLHSVTELNNLGRVFSSPAPGLVMGNGNTGKSLKEYKDAHLYISDDAGVTWIEGPKGPHKYEFGDQGSVLVAVPNAKSGEATVDVIRYSLNHGKDWIDVDLPDKLKIDPWVLTTTPDSTSLKFILSGWSGKRDDKQYEVIAIDFEGLHERTCGKDDMEDWSARTDEDGKPTCLMGHTQSYTRRKKDADCFLKKEFSNSEVVSTNCPCTDADFECDYNFRKDDKGECIVAGPIPAPEEACQDADPDATFQGSSGYRLIPGNTCERTKGKQKDDPVERKCSQSVNPPSDPISGKISVSQKVFGKKQNLQKRYLLRGESSSEQDETIIVHASGEKDVMITHDHGLTWKKVDDLDASKVVSVSTHSYFKDVVYLIRGDGRITYSINRGRTFDEFEAPTKVDLDDSIFPLYFHPDKKDWLIWIGEDKKAGHLVAHLSIDRGDKWNMLQRNVKRCEFTGSSSYRFRDDSQIMCIAREQEDSSRPWQLVAGNTKDGVDADRSDLVIRDVKDFATMAEFIVTAVQNSSASSLQAFTSLDGKTFAEAHFPYNYNVDHQRAYTVLDSSTHAVNLFVAEETKADNRYGSILKSNSNGTSYVVSISGVNCNAQYYVDFEKMLGLEGVVMVNVVANKADRNAPTKLLQTQISHNDGAEWAFIDPPQQDVDGNALACSNTKGTARCALHIQGYTQRENKRNTYSSAGAVGLMFGWGNTGEYLGDVKDTDTYMTTDAGITWKQVKKGQWTWQFGDQGSILVLVMLKTKTRYVSYTLDEGATWHDEQFADEDVEVDDITTMASGTSRKFVVWGKTADRKEEAAYTIDFTGLTNTECKFDKDPSKSDYSLWSPSHPLLGNGCLFGHKTQYLRKKTDRNCYNGYRIEHLYNVENCTCTRSDFECDYNYERQPDGSCALVSGFSPPSHEDWCSDNPSAIEYYESSGYRRIPLTTCVDGTQYDKTGQVHKCPGKDAEFDQKHGISGIALFFAITIPFALAGAAGWWVWKNWNTMSGPFSGQIRLGEGGGAGGSFGQGAFESDSPLVRYPIIAVSAAVAVVGAIPLVLAAVWRTAVGGLDRLRNRSSGGSRGAWSRIPGTGGGGGRTYRTRDSFARGDYVVGGDDEGELLGEDSDDEV